jgi:tripartite motif-containing protein 71
VSRAKRIVLAATAALALAAFAAPSALGAFTLVRTWGNTVNSQGSKVKGQFGTGIPTKAEGGDRQFNDPGGIGIDAAGNLLVADPSNHRMNRYDASGKFLGDFGRHGFDPGGTRVEGVGRMNLPEGVAVKGNKVYVADNRNDRILVWTTTGKWVKRLARRGSLPGRTISPWGIAIAGSTLFAADQGNFRILRFTTGGASRGAFGTFGQSAPGFVTPYAIAVDPKRAIYVTDETTDRILVYTLKGKYAGEFGGTGSGSGKFDRPTGVAVDKAGDVYVSDYCNQRIAHYGPGGKPLKEYIGSTTVDAPTYLAFGPNGNLYVADWHRVMQFAPAAGERSVAHVADRLGSGFC